MECVWPLAASLGEGPLWDPVTGTLLFADIKSGRLHRFDPACGEGTTFELGDAPCFVFRADEGGYVVGNGHLLQRFDGTQVTGEVARIDMRAGNRLNDATVDGQGRLWFGSMDDAAREASGVVYLYDRGAIRPVGGECVITNGPGISGDGRYLYSVDTLGGTITRFDISTDPTLKDGTLFARIDPADGTPDGVTIDAEDHVWVGLWGGWALRRYAPDGTLVQTVEFPCENVTKVAFGGPDLRTAYVTTAKIDLSEEAQAAQPLAGGLFSFRVDVPGRVIPEMRLA